MKDPVCGMSIDAKTAASQVEYKGTTYSFCNASCKTKFDKNPEQYAGKTESTKGSSCCA